MPQSAPPTKSKILFLAANPKDTNQLRLAEELRELRECLRGALWRDRFEVVNCGAVRIQDLQQALLDHSPTIVHFSGHGLGSAGIVLENEQGKAQIVSSRALANLFRLFVESVECVVLNACYSEAQVDGIHQHIGCVMGMKQAIGDKAAIQFTRGFYAGLGAGRSYADSFELGRNGIDLEGIPEVDTPMIKLRSTTSKSETLAPVVNPTEPNPTEPNPTLGAQVFISYRSQEPDQSLAQAFQAGIQGAGFSAFMAGESIRLGEDWAQRIDTELASCEFFVLLLSERSAVSEMVTEEVRRAKQLRDQTGKPMILPIRVQFLIDSPLNYDLRGYLQRIQQREWKSENDTNRILKEILTLLGAGTRKLNAGGMIPATEPEVVEPPEIEERFGERESVVMPPLPVAEPELPGGQVDLGSQFYVERGTEGRASIEARCYEAIATPGALIRIKAPRQMGKTSLMSRILRYGEQQGCLGVPLSFQIADSVGIVGAGFGEGWWVGRGGDRLNPPVPDFGWGLCLGWDELWWEIL